MLALLTATFLFNQNGAARQLTLPAIQHIYALGICFLFLKFGIRYTAYVLCPKLLDIHCANTVIV